MAAVISHGTTILRWDTLTSAWVDLMVGATCTSISLSTTKDVIDITDLSDLLWKQSIAGLAEFEVSVDLNYDPDQHDGTSGWFFDEFSGATSSNTLTLRIQWPLEGATYQRLEFYAIMSGFDLGASVGDKQSLSISFKGTGVITESTITP